MNAQMKEHGFYIIKDTYVQLINELGGKYLDKKERPIYCCIQDKEVADLYWAIPTSDICHRENNQIKKIKSYCDLPKTDIRSAYYHIGTTNRPAIYKVSNAFPITSKYIEKEYISKGLHLVLANDKQIQEIYSKLLRILAYEGRFPNRLEQHITTLKKHLEEELVKDK